VVEHLPRKYKVQGLNPNRKEGKKEGREGGNKGRKK
jgi:hypothetical protein